VVVTIGSVAVLLILSYNTLTKGCLWIADTAS
jgi:hypothetical protein